MEQCIGGMRGIPVRAGRVAVFACRLGRSTANTACICKAVWSIVLKFGQSMATCRRQLGPHPSSVARGAHALAPLRRAPRRSTCRPCCGKPPC